MTVVIAGLFLCGCAGGGGGSSSANGSTVLCGTSEMNARPCSGGGPAPAQPARPEPTMISESTARQPLPLATAPVNTDAGTFGAIALQRPIDSESGTTEYQWPGEHALRIKSDPATQTYTLLLDLPAQAGEEIYDLDDPDFGYQFVITTNYSDGHSQARELDHNLIRGLQTGIAPANPDDNARKDVGYLTVLHASRNVSVGWRITRELYWDPVGRAWNTEGYGCWECYGLDDDYQAKTRLYFAFGHRTAAADMPMSGRATFRLHRNPYENAYYSAAGDNTFHPGLIDDMVLTADFGRRVIAASLDQPPEIRKRESALGVFDVHYWGIRLSGESTFNEDGFFAIPLTGELISQNPADTQRSIALTGRIDGAFFGPGATEIGGVYAIINASQGFLVEGAFGGERQ